LCSLRDQGVPGGEEESFRRRKGHNVRRLAVGAAAAFALALAPAGVAQADAAYADVAIEPNAQYDIQGSILHVELRVTCTGGTGAVVVQVTQSPPETPFPVGFGSGPNAVVCDGQAHEAGVTIFGIGFDAGRATATATLTVVDPLGGQTAATDTDTREIDIRVV
jgi:hypothetical protein